jgi:hypothetical protein
MGSSGIVGQLCSGQACIVLGCCSQGVWDVRSVEYAWGYEKFTETLTHRAWREGTT